MPELLEFAPVYIGLSVAAVAIMFAIHARALANAADLKSDQVEGNQRLATSFADMRQRQLDALMEMAKQASWRNDKGQMMPRGELPPYVTAKLTEIYDEWLEGTTP
jgi:hypothetical protein